MIRYFIVFIFFVVPKMYAQDNDFGVLLELFNHPKREIPEDLAFKYFQFTPKEEALVLLTDRLLIQSSTYVMLSTQYDCALGSDCKRSRVTTFTNKGERVDELVFEQTMADCSFYDTRKPVFISEELIIFKETREKLDCLGNGNPLSHKTWLEIQPIKKGGVFGKAQVDRKSLEREHYMFSFKIFKADELENMTAEELSIIKNEIFANHGYKFKTEKWQEYFTAKPWYVPVEGDVNSKLSEIEKKNIELLVGLKE